MGLSREAVIHTLLPSDFAENKLMELALGLTCHFFPGLPLVALL